MRIQHNIMAMNAYRNYNKNTSALSKNLEKLSSGYKINRAGDDAAGLAISEKMRAQITGLNAAQKNVKDGISLVKTAEGAMQEIQDMLNRMDYLATQSANGTYDDPVDRYNLQKEVNQLRSEINRIADSANFNGIKLLDGSLDTDRASAKASAISNIVTSDFAAAGSSPAFEAKYIINRPEAETTQTNAVFKVSLDDVNITGYDENDEITLTVGNATIKFVAASSGNPTDTSELATALAQCGIKHTGTDAVVFTGGAKPSDAKSDTATWDAKVTDAAATDGTDAAAKYIKIDGHWYEMSASGKELTFTQVDFTGTGGKQINPDYAVSIKAEDKSNATDSTDLEMTGTTNWQVQKTTAGKGIGTAQQAQVSVDIDFSKIKNGDQLIVGEKVYSFQIGKDSTTATTDAGAADGKPTNNIDLSKIFATEEDLADEAKQAQAMVEITKQMGAAGSSTWSTGNEGVKNGVGTLTFQSLSTYAGDKTGATSGKVYVGKGTGTEGTLCDMRTEAGVMSQFVSRRAEQSATVTFDLDVSKIKVGDTFTIDGTTFEFTDSESGVTKGNIKIDLTAQGIGGGIPAYKTDEVMKAIKTAVDAQLADAAGAKYTTSYDGNTFKLVSKDIASTDAKENRVAADLKLPEGALNGKGLVLQIGDTSDDFNQLSVSVGDMHTKALKIDGIDIGNQDGAKDAIQSIKDAINYVSGVRGDLGATQNRLEHTANNLSVMAENIQDAESTIRDTDVAEEMMAYTKNNILIQSAQAMLAQANAVPQGVLQLLG